MKKMIKMPRKYYSGKVQRHHQLQIASHKNASSEKTKYFSFEPSIPSLF